MKKLALVVLLALIMIVLNACNAPEQSTTSIDDGPHIYIQDQDLDVNWLCNNNLNRSSVSLSDLPYNFSECGLSAKVHKIGWTTSPIEYEGNFKIAAFSDAHGQYDLLTRLLQNNNIIDQDLNWQFGNGHLVITGDMFDRGDKVTEILWFIFGLEQQAIDAGGNIHILLGNHEVMVMNGNLKYLHDKYHQAANLFNTSYDALYSRDSVLGAWLRSKNVLAKVNGYLFAHGGLHPDLATNKNSLQSINQAFRDNLVKSELEAPREGFGEYLHGRSGPVWYRGYFREPTASPDQIDSLLEHFNVKGIVVGHTSQDRIRTRYQGKVIAIDTSIKKGQYGEILFIDGNKRWRGDLAGIRRELE